MGGWGGGGSGWLTSLLGMGGVQGTGGSDADSHQEPFATPGATPAMLHCSDMCQCLGGFGTQSWKAVHVSLAAPSLCVL